jgi:hypothetical protein
LNPRRSVVTGALAFLLLALTLSAPTASSATTAADWGPGFKACGRFKDHGGTIHVFAKDISCAKSRRIQKAVWLGPHSGWIVHIPKEGPEEIRLKRFPGYVCISGTGGGTCTKGKKVSAYSNLP